MIILICQIYIYFITIQYLSRSKFKFVSMKILNTYLYLIISFLICCNVRAQILSNKQESEIRKTIYTQFYEASEELKYNFGFNNIQCIGKDTLYNPDGYHYVFRLTQGKAERIDKCTFHGANFQRFLFQWKGNLFAMGGYGFFTTNNNLQFFNARLKGWTYKNTFGNKPPFILGVTFVHKNKIYAFNNFKSGNTATNDLIDSNLYILDLPKMRWEKFPLTAKNVHFTGRAYHTKDFVLYVGNTHSILLAPKTLNYLVWTNEDVSLNRNAILSIDENTLTLKNNFPAYSKNNIYTIDLAAKWRNNPHKITLRWNETPYEKNVSIFSTRTISVQFLIFLVLSLLLAISMVYYLRRKRATNTGIDYNELEQKLISEKRMLNTEELDALFGIEHMDTDSKKFKRNRMINEMNQRHPDFITRQKDDTDKRRFLYQIKF